MSLQAKITAAAEFLADAPPGEIGDVYDDIKSLVHDDALISGLQSAFGQYNADQLVTVTLPGASKPTVLSKYNRLQPNKFFDTELAKAFTVDHKSLVRGPVIDSLTVQRVGSVDDHAAPTDVVASIILDIKHYVGEHFPDPSAYGVYPQSDDEIAVVIVGNQYSPANYWNGRWRSSYVADLSTGTLTGAIAVDVHYYEDGNVRLKAAKQVAADFNPLQTLTIVQAIAALERAYQEQLNKEFAGLSDGAFKSLRRQLPVTRSKIEWGKSIGAYRLGQDIGGGRSK